ncbi:MAG: hypothetical protein Q4D88_03130 [Anaerococcus sp.]|nr:hypothetical protein [Anaerococcus sp.]
MKDSFKTFVVIEKTSLSKMINSIAFIFRKTPLLGKHLGESYRFFELKEIVYFFYPIFSILKHILGSAMTLLLVGAFNFFIFSLLRNFGPITNLFPKDLDSNWLLLEYLSSLMIFPLTYFSTALFKNFIIEYGQPINEYFTIYYMKPEYLFDNFLYHKPLIRFISRTIVFMIAFKIVGDLSPLRSLGLSLAILFVEISASVFWLARSLKKKPGEKKSIIDKSFFQFLLIIAIDLLLSFLVLKFRPKFIDLFILGIATVFLIRALSYMRSFTGHAKVVEMTNREFELVLSKIEKANDHSLKLTNEDINNKSVKGEGFAYLNKLFFQRHKRLIIKPIVIKSIIILILGILAFILSLMRVLKDLDQKDLFTSLIIILTLAMYIACTQKNILRAMYLNCDQGLMPYGFYRTSSNILTMFKERLGSLLKIMAIPSLSNLITYLLLTYNLGEISIGYRLMGVLYIILVGLFFTSLPLAQYYIFQPFDQEGKVVGKASSILDFFVYFLIFYVFPSLSIKLGAFYFMVLVGAIGLVFFFLSQVLTYKLGSKTFRIRS